MNRMLPCYWHEDGHGGRMIIPGCVARYQDPDNTECDCPTLASRLEEVEAERDCLKAELASVWRWHACVVAAVHAHPEGIAIMQAAARNAEQGLGAPGGHVQGRGDGPAAV